MKKLFILISGKTQSGKNTFADLLEKEFRSIGKTVVQDSFANQLKINCENDFRKFATIMNDKVAQIDALARSLFSSHRFNNGSLLEAIQKELEQLKIFDDNWHENKTVLTRSILETVGTDIFKKRIDSQHWAKIVYERAKSLTNVDVILITDWRFPDEFEVFQDEFLYEKHFKPVAIRVERSTKIKNDHSSNTSLDDFECFDYVIDNNKSLKNLEHIAKDFVEDVVSEKFREIEE